ISGNVNADESIGTRITVKKMYNSEGNVLPFVSARAIKYAIRQTLEARGYKIDPFIKEGQQLNDSGNPKEYIDNDLFGYMSTQRGGKKGEGKSFSRQAPIALSYLKALYDTPVSTEFAARFPRDKNQKNPVPFEIEVVEFIGRLNSIIYDYIGKSEETEEQSFILDENERKKRLKDFLEIFLSPTYVLPRRTNSLNIPEYLWGMIVLSLNGPKPIYQYLDYKMEGKEIKLNEDKLKYLKSILGESDKFFLVNYGTNTPSGEFLKETKTVKVKEAVEEICNFYFS
ncbi:MAG: type I-B CRISPR-associated protein Cas7/Cst2/DevR, partial [Candidatus Omnitrophica bacterium]|nr:type I-B CRISPR-associated protein Cas7/Cst2/DevR [Candidatus Omnitrophota bacterium]